MSDSTVPPRPISPSRTRKPDVLASAHAFVGDFALDSLERLPALDVAYHAGGAAIDHDNVVVVLHALTGTSNAGTDWWNDVVGTGKAIDTRHYRVIAPVLPGSCYGTTWRGHGEGPIPALTTRDQARAVWALLDHLGVSAPALVTGGSLGGMVALEIAATRPAAVRRTVVFAAPAAHGAWAIGWHHLQREIIDALGDEQGLAVARAVATLSFRSEREFNGRFGRTQPREGRFAVQDYLDHQGRKLVARFDARAWRTLSAAMDAHDVGRGRGGIATALRAIRGTLVGVGITGDGLYGEREVTSWTELAGARARRIESTHGHDAFLLEQRQVARIVRSVLDAPGGARDDAPDAGRAA